jgi:hypothetical protein
MPQKGMIDFGFLEAISLIDENNGGDCARQLALRHPQRQ